MMTAERNTMTASQNSASTMSTSGWRRTTSMLALMVGLWAALMSAQSVMPTPRQQFLDNNGDPCASCLLYSYLAGTNTPTATYADVTLQAPNANPVVLDSAGRATVFLDTRITYKFSLHTAADVPIWTVDSVDSVPSGLNVDVSGVAGEVLAQRQIVYLSSGLDATTAGRWYLTDADVVSKSSGASLVGVVISPAIGAAASGTIRIQGRVTGYSGLSEGLSYFVSATAGDLTSTAPANVKVVGVAESASSLLLTPSAATSGGVGAFSSLQVSSTANNSIDTAGGIAAPSANSVFGAITFTGIGGAAAGKIGVSGNQLVFLGASSGHAFLNSAGGPTTTVNANGNWSMTGRINSATLQPGFVVSHSTNQSTGGTSLDLAWDTETQDSANNFAANAFTAPVTGTYLLISTLKITNTSGGSSTYTVNFEIDAGFAVQFAAGGSEIPNGVTAMTQGTLLLPLTAGTTVKCNVTALAGGMTVIGNLSDTRWSGRLLP